MIEVAEVKQLVREWLCRDCKGTRFGKIDCDDETFCGSFAIECADIKAEAKALEGVSAL